MIICYSGLSKQIPNAMQNVEQIVAPVKWRLSITWIGVLGCAGTTGALFDA
jgi:hypothetical protein